MGHSMDDLFKDLEQYQLALDDVFQRQGVVLAYLFGSQARGDAGPLSDVDVAVLFGPDVPEDEQCHRLLRLVGELGSVSPGMCLRDKFGRGLTVVTPSRIL